MRSALARGVEMSAIKAVGITNQRETTLLWSRRTGRAFHNAIVWNDVRTTEIAEAMKARFGGQDAFRAKTGLPISEYFSALKLRWIIDNVPEAASAVASGDALFGTVDTWLTWHITGRQLHITDVTNASRTMLMDIKTLQWDEDQLKAFGIPRHILPEIKSSSEIYGWFCSESPLPGVPLSGILGDQQAALFGQAALHRGMAKSTFGTGAFIMMNTGEEIVPSRNGLLTTPAYKLGNAPCVYALEGACFSAGSIVNWVRDKLELMDDIAEMTEACDTTESNGGVYFVPAFSGLGSPHWEATARGTICGLTFYSSKAHVLRATVEAVAFQVADVLGAMEKDSGSSIVDLKVDGGMTRNQFLLQFQANLLDVNVVRAAVKETTALGAAYAAGLAIGLYSSPAEIAANWKSDARFTPQMSSAERAETLSNWEAAVERSRFWAGPKKRSFGGKFAFVAGVAAVTAIVGFTIGRMSKL